MADSEEYTKWLAFRKTVRPGQRYQTAGNARYVTVRPTSHDNGWFVACEQNAKVYVATYSDLMGWTRIEEP